MIHIEEWESPKWVSLQWDAIPPPPGEAPRPLPGSSGVRLPGLPDFIRAQLEALASPSPAAVHFYNGEGLRWIRVGFDGGEALQPATLAKVGNAIAACLPQELELYFHALRPHDLLFFLQGNDPGNTGLEAGHYGEPLREVLQDWGLAAAG